MDTRTINAYDQYAEAYDEEVVEFWDNFPKEILEEFAKSLPGKKVLNVGSGSGRDAVLLRDLGLEIICVDASRSMVAMTEELGFQSHLMSFEDLQFADEIFDGVWAYNTSLIHVSKEAALQALEQLHALLRPGGSLLFGAIEGTTVGMVKRKTMPGVERYFQLYERAELRKLVESASFRFVYEQDYQPGHHIYLNQLYTKAS